MDRCVAAEWVVCQRKHTKRELYQLSSLFWAHQNSCRFPVRMHDIWFRWALQLTMFSLFFFFLLCTITSPFRNRSNFMLMLQKAEKRPSLLNAKQCYSSFVSLNSPTACRIINALNELNVSVSTETRKVCLAGPLVQFLAASSVKRLKGARQGEAGSVCCFSNKQTFGARLQRSTR